MFEHEDARTFFEKIMPGDKASDKDAFLRAVGASNIDHYTRESFVMLLKLIKTSLGMTSESWMQALDWFFNIHTADRSMPMDQNNSHDLWTHLYRHGLYTAVFYRTPPLRNGRFRQWSTVPVLVRVVFVVPRDKLSEMGSIKDLGTPPMNCVVHGKGTSNIFSAVHVAFGRVIPMGTPARPWVRFEEAADGWKGSSPLVVSFIMPSVVLTHLEPPEDLLVSLAFRSTAGNTMQLAPKLGLALCLHDAPLMDESSVFILPEAPIHDSPTSISPCSVENIPRIAEIGSTSPPSVELDDECELVSSMTIRLSVDDESMKLLFQSGTSPQVSQISPCVMRLLLGNCKQDVVFPFPVIGSQSKLRLARKSMYIEA
jgi:hypothetical protein